MSQPAEALATPNIGALIDELYGLREELRALAKTERELKAKRDEVEQALLAVLDSQGLEMGRGAKATASVNELIMPSIEDYDTFARFVYRNKALYLLERRPAAAAFRELLESRNNRKIPGLTSYPKRTIGLRARS